ncbi:MAG TPA: VOC family protein [Thermoanaerobaculia bacterium]|jgi:methylmalonyl-CoA/ethylmalonyl-CoA epimerase|nr:VOC family protein [Thermoanaerobaculia bacterium]
MSNPNAMDVLSRYAKSIDHLAIAVPDLETSIEFYSKVLGFTLRERRETKGKATAMVSAVMEAGPVTAVLLQGTSSESQVSRYVEHYGPGVQHVAIAVENLPQFAEDLKEAGIEFDTNVIEGGGLRQIFTHRDPGSGMMFEFIERLGGDFSDESVKNLFQQLEEKDSF